MFRRDFLPFAFAPLSIALAAAPVMANSPAVTDTQAELDTVVVTADFRDAQLQQIPEAVSVMSSEQLQARSAEHLESVLSLAPNVNFSSGASRGRYFQIRGIGERSQFIDPVNPSVGLIIDGIDMTGLGAESVT